MATDNLVSRTLNNVIEPIDPRGAGGVKYGGLVQTVALEVAVSKGLRWLLKMEQRSVADLAILHTVSQGLIGGFGAIMFKAPAQADGSVKVFDALKDGAKGIPALVAAQYVVNTAAKGMHIPTFSFKDLLITGSSKALTRPLINQLVSMKWYPDMLKNSQIDHDLRVEKQYESARFGKASADDSRR